MHFFFLLKTMFDNRPGTKLASDYVLIKIVQDTDLEIQLSLDSGE